ncbi:MAG TPA: transglycosylase SLT domain-containing protein, partial [Spirochaetota bacterium]|nr:transglycosylase SLT domain-containing protein [Spirochaetota bacterium]
MINKTVAKALLALVLAGVSCSGKNPEYGIKFNPFYTTPEEILSGIEKKTENYYNNYILARAYASKKEYKTALLYYANSCFVSKYDFNIRLFPYPVYSFLDSWSSKSPYYNDAVYEIASIFYLYNEHKYVIKFTDLMEEDDSALYRDSVILRAKSLQKIKKYTEAEKALLTLVKQYSDNSSAATIYMRLASIYESSGKYNKAVSAYIKILKLTRNAWHDDIAVKRIIHLISSRGVKIADPENRTEIAESLFDLKEYSAAEKFIAETVKKGGNKKASLLYLKILTKKRYAESIKYLQSLDKSPSYDEFALAHANVLWENGNKYRAIQIYSTIANSKNSDLAERVLTRISFYYEERGNPSMLKYMEIYRKRFPDDEQSGRFTWLMGRYFLKNGKYDTASSYFIQGIKNYPRNPYTGNCRYWLFKISHLKKSASGNDGLILLQDLAFYNPDSPHTLNLLSEYAEKISLPQAREFYKKAEKTDNNRLMHLYHTVLFMKEGYTPEFHDRFSGLDSSVTSKHESFNRFFESGSYKSGYGDILNSLEKYFEAGDTDSINREINILPVKDLSVQIDLSLAMSRFARKYRHYNYSTFYAFRLLKTTGVQENLALFSGNFARTLYPDAFIECVIKESRKSGVKPELVLAMMKAESNFNSSAVSPVGAAGLMQLMPLTAKGIARELGIKDYNLKSPCTSVKFGAHYISWLDRYYKGEVELMVAGYNAGVGNVDRWLKRFSGKETDYISEFTPYPETRDYIFRTKKYTIQFHSIYSQDFK